MRNWRLSIRPIIHEDESIEGFIVRIAENNGYEEIDAPYKALYHFRPVLNDIRKTKNFNYKDYIYYELAEELTGQLITNRVYNRKYLSSKELLLGHGNRSYSSVTRYCPKCIAESMYHRIYWSIIPVITCKKHFCFLEYKCPHCNEAVNIKTTIAGICTYCNKSIVLDEYVTKDQNFVINQLEYDYFSTKKIFLNLNSQELFRLQKWLMFCILDNSKIYKDKYSLDITYSKLSNMVRIADPDLDKLKELLILVNGLMSNWPNHLLIFMKNELETIERGNFFESFFQSNHNGKMRTFNFLNYYSANLF